MAGTTPFSMSQRLDVYGKPLSGGLFYTFVAGTTSTPQNTYQDIGLTIPYPNPIVLDSAGFIPQHFCADGLIKIRLTDHAGVVQIVADNVQVIGPSSGGGGGGGTIDPTTIFVTGDIKPRYGVGIHPGVTPGWVRANGMGIGSLTSSGTPGVGTERANADCQALFEYLWVTDPTLAVSAGRGATAHADWLANKQISLPDYRGYALGALDDMGNAAANRYQGWGFTPTSAVTLGGTGGASVVVLTTNNLPPYTPGGTITNGTLHPTFNGAPGQVVLNNGKPGGSAYFGGSLLAELLAGSISITQDASSFTGNAQGGISQGFVNFGPRKLCTFYMKL